MTNKKHPVNCVFGTGAGPDLIRRDVPETKWLRSTQVNNRPSLKKGTNQKVSCVGTITLQSEWETLRYEYFHALHVT